MATGDQMKAGREHTADLTTGITLEPESGAEAAFRAKSTTKIGMKGESDLDAGVVGRSNASAPQFDKAGVRGTSKDATGVVGTSTNDVGVKGQSTTYIGVMGVGDLDAGVYGHSQRQSGVVGSTGDPVHHYAGFFWGALGVNGPLHLFGGTKSAAVPHRDGTYRLLYAMESPENWFEDFGSARLVRGRASVKLDPEFAAVVRLNDYHVFVTPEGDSRGLYVTSKTSRGFEVREQQGGRGTLKFSYRVVARRKDVRVERFEKVKLPKKPAPPPMAPRKRNRSR